MINCNSRIAVAVAVILAGFLLVASPVGAFDVKLAFVVPSGDYSGEYFTNGFWVAYRSDYSSNTYFTEIVNASSGKTVLTLDDLVGSVVPVGGYLLISTTAKEYSLRLYHDDGGTYDLVWSLDTSRYGWVSYILPVREKNLILAGTVDVSQNDFGGHYVLGVDFNGAIKFATNLNVVGQTVSDIVPTGDREYLVIVPGLGDGTPYLGLIDESGNILRSVRINYPLASTVYLQGNRFVMVSWQKKREGYIKDIKTYYGVWTLNLTPVATFELPYGFLGATSVFANDSLYLFTVRKSNSTCTLVESVYLPNGTLVWERAVENLKYNVLPKHYGIATNSVKPVLLPYSNVYVGIYPCGDLANVVAVDFTDAVPLAETYLPMVKTASAYSLYYDTHYIRTGTKVYLLNTTAIPSAILVNSTPVANVTVDEKYSGRTPFYLRTNPGKHEVRVLRANYSPVTRVLTVGPHQGVRLFVKLNPMNATLHLNSTPAAEVDILPVGLTVSTPATVSLPNGTYTLIFESKEYPGQYGRVRKTVTLAPNETATVNVELPLLRSELLVTSNVGNATVYVDGKDVGTVPVNVSVVPGSHNVTVRAEGYIAKSLTINATRPVLNVSPSSQTRNHHPQHHFNRYPHQKLDSKPDKFQ